MILILIGVALVPLASEVTFDDQIFEFAKLILLLIVKFVAFNCALKILFGDSHIWPGHFLFQNLLEVKRYHGLDHLLHERFIVLIRAYPAEKTHFPG